MGTIQRSATWAHSNTGRLTRPNIRIQIFDAFTDSDGNAAKAVNDKVYREVNMLEGQAVRELIQEAIDEWQNGSR